MPIFLLTLLEIGYLIFNKYFNYKKIQNKILMVIVFYKVAALALKVFSKPFIDQTKKIHLSQDAKATHPILRNIFIGMGNRFNYY
jgi:hypothetical protein